MASTPSCTTWRGRCIPALTNACRSSSMSDSESSTSRITGSMPFDLSIRHHRQATSCGDTRQCDRYAPHAQLGRIPYTLGRGVAVDCPAENGKEWVVAAGASQLCRNCEISADFIGGVRVRTEGNGHLSGVSQGEKGVAWISLLALLAEPAVLSSITVSVRFAAESMRMNKGVQSCPGTQPSFLGRSA